MNAREKPTEMKMLSDQNGFSEHFNHSLHFVILACALFSIYFTFSAVLKYFMQIYRRTFGSLCAVVKTLCFPTFDAKSAL